MDKKIYQEPRSIDMSTVSATVVRKCEIQIENFNDVICPFCGEKMKIKAINFDIAERTEDYVQHTHSWTDDIGQFFSENFGRTKHTEEQELNMFCLNGCVTDMIIPVKRLSYSPYKKLN